VLRKSTARFAIRVFVMVAVSALAMVLADLPGHAPKVSANPGPHHGYGTGSHIDATHANNPGHVFISVGSPNPGRVTSGGQFHDACTGIGDGKTCGPGWDGQLSVDVAYNGADSDLWLYLDYGGYTTGGATNPPNLSYDFWIGASIIATGGSGSCEWRLIQVRAAWWDQNGVLWDNRVIGTVRIAHGSSWAGGIGYSFTSNYQYPTGYGGWVHPISGLYLGQVGPSGAGSCTSTGRHIHTELNSTHGSGVSYEWHSLTGDGCCDFMPFNNLGQLSLHTHDGFSSANDSVPYGRVLAFLGGGYAGYSGWWSIDNPWSADH
jgi:hypothetical protein